MDLSSSSGTANFALNIGGQSCTLSIPVAVMPVGFTCGISTVTFTYKGASVTYGTVVGANNQCWLDRNLGASQVATSQTDANAYGDLFQWGRGDDGHQDRNSATTTVRSAGDVPGHANFIRHSSNWRTTNSDNLWQGVNGINNPCPTGWRVPTLPEWVTERQSWSSNNIAGAFASPLKMTLGGWRNGTATLEYVNSTGWYHSSTPATAYTNWSQYLYVEVGAAGTNSTNQKVHGASVRCIKD